PWPIEFGVRGRREASVLLRVASGGNHAERIADTPDRPRTRPRRGGRRRLRVVRAEPAAGGRAPPARPVGGRPRWGDRRRPGGPRALSYLSAAGGDARRRGRHQESRV